VDDGSLAALIAAEAGDLNIEVRQATIGLIGKTLDGIIGTLGHTARYVADTN